MNLRLPFMVLITFLVSSGFSQEEQEESAKRSRRKIGEAVQVEPAPLYAKLYNQIKDRLYSDVLKTLEEIQAIQDKFNFPSSSEIEVKLNALFELRRYRELIATFSAAQNPVDPRMYITYLFTSMEPRQLGGLRKKVTQKVLPKLVI
jgi:hypothetical protein